MRGLILLATLFAQNEIAIAPAWLRTTRTEVFSGSQYQEFTLTGQFLQAPARPETPHPTFVIHCVPGEHGVGYHVYRNGRFLSAHVNVGAVLANTPAHLPAEYRLDDGRPQREAWDVSTDLTSAFVNEVTTNNLVFGHVISHRDNSSAPVKKLVIRVNEDLAVGVVMQFNMPDPTEMAEACGLIVHKK